jgi:hypothetical protein
LGFWCGFGFRIAGILLRFRLRLGLWLRDKFWFRLRPRLWLRNNFWFRCRVRIRLSWILRFRLGRWGCSWILRLGLSRWW